MKVYAFSKLAINEIFILISLRELSGELAMKDCHVYATAVWLALVPACSPKLSLFGQGS